MTEVSIKRILCMEDDPGVSSLLQKRLERQGYAVDLARNGEEGLSMAARYNYDLLIVDYNMPFFGGLDVIRSLSASVSPPPVIMITGEGNEEIAVEALKLGAADYIVKDVELKFLGQLPSVIHQVLYRQHLLTERKQMLETIRESEERYRRLFESNPHPMWVFDIESLAFLAVNEAAIRHYGYSREEFLSMTLKDIRPDEDVRQFIAASEEFGLEGIQSGVSRHRRKDGTIIHIEVVSHPIVFGQRKARFSLITDITRRKKIEDELLKTQRLESLGTLAGGLAHEFNNLLTGIMGNIALVKLDLPEGKEAHERLTDAERTTEKARSLARQLLTFAQGGAPVKKLLSIGELVRTTGTFALHGSKNKADISVPDDLWATEADESQISQVITNLVNNADQAMPEGGIIRVTCRNVTIEAQRGLPLAPGKFVMISIADEGSGIPRAHINRIFDPYFTTKDKNSGLGLATAYSIVKRHNGHITVESGPGAGSTFTVYLPSTGMIYRSQPEASVTVKSGSGRILIMDDEDIILDVAGRILTRLGYQVAFAKNGAEAITRYSQARSTGNPFDLVIMDLTVPGGMGGKEAVKKIREIDPSAKAIVSSGYCNDPVLAHYSDYGFNGIVSKPYSIKILSDTVMKVISNTDIPS